MSINADQMRRWASQEIDEKIVNRFMNDLEMHLTHMMENRRPNDQSKRQQFIKLRVFPNEYNDAEIREIMNRCNKLGFDVGISVEKTGPFWKRRVTNKFIAVAWGTYDPPTQQ